MPYTFVSVHTVKDPITNDDVELEVWYDHDTCGIFAIESLYLDSSSTFHNPFTGNSEVIDEALPDQNVYINEDQV